MKIVQINTFSNKSTGTIMMKIHKTLIENGIDSYIVWGRGRKSNNNTEICINDKLGIYFHGLYTRITDKTGFASSSATKKLIKELEIINPDIIHLHNLHGYYINIEMLFTYIKKNNKKVIWTFHDCWPFTGHCYHFEYINCKKWQKQCYKCPQIKEYPKSFVDNSQWNYLRKKELFSNLNLTIVVPSQWLAKLIKESFFKSYDVKVINNGIDTDVFKHRNSDFGKKYGLENKRIILGVASPWNKLKGFEDFLKLSEIIDDETRIVLVGLSDKQIKQVENTKIIGISRTSNAIELAEIYSTADLFFNPTYADNFPTTNLESLACSTPVITYNTGGSPEVIKEKNGAVTDFEDFCKNYNKYLTKKYFIDSNDIYSSEKMISNYIDLYNDINKSKLEVKK